MELVAESLLNVDYQSCFSKFKSPFPIFPRVEISHVIIIIILQAIQVLPRQNGILNLGTRVGLIKEQKKNGANDWFHKEEFG